MTNWKYADTTNTVVSRAHDDGKIESCLVSAIADWLSGGNTPEPADIPPAPTYQELRAAAYPSIPDQLDTIFHGGTEGWMAEIQAVKDAYPKEPT